MSITDAMEKSVIDEERKDEVVAFLTYDGSNNCVSEPILMPSRKVNFDTLVEVLCEARSSRGLPRLTYGVCLFKRNPEAQESMFLKVVQANAENLPKVLDPIFDCFPKSEITQIQEFCSKHPDLQSDTESLLLTRLSHFNDSLSGSTLQQKMDAARPYDPFTFILWRSGEFFENGIWHEMKPLATTATLIDVEGFFPETYQRRVLIGCAHATGRPEDDQHLPCISVGSRVLYSNMTLFGDDERMFHWDNWSFSLSAGQKRTSRFEKEPNEIPVIMVSIYPIDIALFVLEKAVNLPIGTQLPKIGSFPKNSQGKSFYRVGFGNGFNDCVDPKWNEDGSVSNKAAIDALDRAQKISGGQKLKRVNLPGKRLNVEENWIIKDAFLSLKDPHYKAMHIDSGSPLYIEDSHSGGCVIVGIASSDENTHIITQNVIDYFQKKVSDQERLMKKSKEEGFPLEWDF
jgi:hypothetical protein